MGLLSIYGRHLVYVLSNRSHTRYSLCDLDCMFWFLFEGDFKKGSLTHTRSIKEVKKNLKHFRGVGMITKGML